MVARSPRPPASSRARDSLFLSKLWLAVVLLFVLWQPLKLGFYLDDWSVVVGAAHQGSAFSGKRFQYVVAVDPSRPGIVVPRYVLSSLLGGSAFWWQLAMLLANAAVVVGIACAARAIAGAESIWRPLAFASTWLLLPWSTSNHFWSILLPVQILLAVFALLILSAARKGPPGMIVIAVQALLYLWLCTSYEVFYGQFVALGLVAFGLVILERLEFRTAVSFVLSLTVAQALAIVWYFESAKWAAIHRPIEHTWITTAEANFKQLLPQMAISFAEVRWPLCILTLTLIAMSAVVFWSSRRKWAVKRNICGLALLVAAPAVGALLSLICLSMGGRPFSGTGVDNRTFILISFWLVLMITVSAVVIDRLFVNRSSRAITIGVALACGICLGIAHTFRTLDWADAWIRQNDVLRDVPVEQMSNAKRGAMIILINPLSVNGAPIFGATWDINTAVPVTYPVLAGHPITIYSMWLGPMYWDGEQLRYDMQHPVAKTSDVYLWRPLDHFFVHATRPFEIGMDLSVRYLP